MQRLTPDQKRSFAKVLRHKCRGINDQRRYQTLMSAAAILETFAARQEERAQTEDHDAQHIAGALLEAAKRRSSVCVLCVAFNIPCEIAISEAPRNL